MNESPHENRLALNKRPEYMHWTYGQAAAALKDTNTLKALANATPHGIICGYVNRATKITLCDAILADSLKTIDVPNITNANQLLVIDENAHTIKDMLGRNKAKQFDPINGGYSINGVYFHSEKLSETLRTNETTLEAKSMQSQITFDPQQPGLISYLKNGENHKVQKIGDYSDNCANVKFFYRPDATHVCELYTQRIATAKSIEEKAAQTKKRWEQNAIIGTLATGFGAGITLAMTQGMPLDLQVVQTAFATSCAAMLSPLTHHAVSAFGMYTPSQKRLEQKATAIRTEAQIRANKENIGIIFGALTQPPHM